MHEFGGGCAGGDGEHKVDGPRRIEARQKSVFQTLPLAASKTNLLALHWGTTRNLCLRMSSVWMRVDVEPGDASEMPHQLGKISIRDSDKPETLYFSIRLFK